MNEITDRQIADELVCVVLDADDAYRELPRSERWVQMREAVLEALDALGVRWCVADDATPSGVRDGRHLMNGASA